MQLRTLQLPQHDSRSGPRQDQLASARETYRYSYEWPPGVAVAAEVPRSDTYSANYIAHLLPSSWDLFRNTLGLVDLVAETDGLRRFFESEGLRVPTLEPHEIGNWYLRIANDLSSYVSSTQPVTIDSYRALHRAIPVPELWDVWREDRAFAWQRVAGVNPMPLARVREIPEHIAIDQAVFSRALGAGASLDAALAEGRLFACDYGYLDGAATGVSFGRKKSLAGPYGLFAAIDGTLRPVAIQLGKARESGVFVPSDGSAWMLAKLVLQIADGNHHETSSHLGRTHMVMEAVTLALRRQLAERHPLHRLLLPHCEFTLPINNSAATNLIAPGGAVDRVFGGKIEVSAGLVKASLDSFSLLEAGVPTEIASRGLDDREVLPEHPYRDDATLVFGAIRRFVERYVRIYYESDADVVADTELSAFVDELGAQNGGRLRGLSIPRTTDALVSLVSNIVWLASGQHAAVNFPQYPFMGVVPNLCGALWGTWPPANPADPAELVAQMPPYNMAVLQIHTVFQLSSLRINHLGRYGIAHFLDGAARDAADTFEKELDEIEKTLTERDATRYMPYPHLFPSNIPQSIHI